MIFLHKLFVIFIMFIFLSSALLYADNLRVPIGEVRQLEMFPDPEVTKELGELDKESIDISISAISEAYDKYYNTNLVLYSDVIVGNIDNIKKILQNKNVGQDFRDYIAKTIIKSLDNILLSNKSKKNVLSNVQRIISFIIKLNPSLELLNGTVVKHCK